MESYCFLIFLLKRNLLEEQLSSLLAASRHILFAGSHTFITVTKVALPHCVVNSIPFV